MMRKTAASMMSMVRRGTVVTPCIGLIVWVAAVATFAAGEPSGKCAPGLIPDVFVYSELLDDEIGEKHHAVVVDKYSQQLHLFEFQGIWRLIDTWPCSTGKIVGRKQREGDARTPEGIYYAVRHVPGRYLSDIYGACALPLNYPNWLDRKADRSGSAIWLHGTDKPLRERDSNGCVVLENKHIITLAGMIRLRQTPIIIVDQLQWWRQQDADQWSADLIDLVDHWQNDMMGDSYEHYKRWYAQGASATMEWWLRWCRIRYTRSRDIAFGRIQALNFDILKSDNTFTISFNQFLEAGGRRVPIGLRLLYIQNIAGKLHIIGEEQFISVDRKPSRTTRDPLFAAWQKIKPQATGKNSVAPDRGLEQES